MKKVVLRLLGGLIIVIILGILIIKTTDIVTIACINNKNLEYKTGSGESVGFLAKDETKVKYSFDIENGEAILIIINKNRGTK